MPLTDAALVLGGAHCVWDDVDALEGMIGEPWPGIVVACNDAGADWPRHLHHWVSYHPEKFYDVCEPGSTGAWLERRHANGHKGGYRLWSSRSPDLVDDVLPMNGGSSGWLAVHVALKVGAAKIVLCGVPMTREPHYHDGQDGMPWREADTHWKHWKSHMHEIEGNARSMSGRTRDELGEPTPEFLGMT